MIHKHRLRSTLALEILESRDCPSGFSLVDLGGLPGLAYKDSVAYGMNDLKKGAFREDLLFRLNVVNLNVPPLRERPADVVALAEHFARKYAALNGVSPRPLSEAARLAVASAKWPGNVRELENAMHRAVLLAAGEEIDRDAIRLPDGSNLQQKSLPAGDAETGETLVGRTVAEVEQALILQTLEHCLGNRTHAATILGISIRTLRYKLKLYSDEGVAVPPPAAERASA